MATLSGICTKCGKPIWSTDTEPYAVYLPQDLDPQARFPFHPSCLAGQEARIRATRAQEADAEAEADEPPRGA